MANPKPKPPAKPGKTALALPTARTKPKLSLWDNPSLIYGPPKVGKTTFANSIPGAIFLATEPGTHALSVYEMEIRTWQQFADAVILLGKGDHDFTTIIVDTIDNAWDYLCDVVAAENNVGDLGDMDYGRGYSQAKTKLKKVLDYLARLPYGVMLISHSVDREMTPKNQRPYTKTQPTLPNSARKVVMPLCSYIFFADFETSEEKGELVTRRVLRTKPCPAWDAGDRTGRLPHTLPLDYEELQKAFAALGGG